MRRILVTFLTLLLLWVLVTQVNHALSEVHVYLFVGGLFITYAALTFRLYEGLIVSFLAGLLFDTSLTMPPDFSRLTLGFAHLHALLFVIAHAIVFSLRDRLPRDETPARVIVAVFANLGLFLVFSFIQFGRIHVPPAAWTRLVADLIGSQLFLALVAPWFFALQARALVITRIDRVGLA